MEQHPAKGLIVEAGWDMELSTRRDSLNVSETFEEIIFKLFKVHFKMNASIRNRHRKDILWVLHDKC